MRREKKLINTLGLFLVTFLLFTKSAYTQVHSLEEGACWYEKSGRLLKLASFNEKLAVDVDLNAIQYYINQNQIREYRVVTKHLFCSAAFTSILVKAKSELGSYSCFHFFFSTDGIELGAKYPVDPNRSGACLGFEKGQVFANPILKSEDAAYIIRRYNDVDKVDGRLVYLKEGLESEIKLRDKLNQDESLKNYQFEVDSILFPVGTYRSID